MSEDNDYEMEKPLTPLTDSAERKHREFCAKLLDNFWQSINEPEKALATRPPDGWDTAREYEVRLTNAEKEKHKALEICNQALCMYCGARMERSSEILRDHALSCRHHPMFQLRALSRVAKRLAAIVELDIQWLKEDGANPGVIKRRRDAVNAFKKLS